MATNPCDASSIGQFIAGNYLLCRQRDKLISQGQAQVQSVATNAAAAYGSDSQAAQVAQEAANANKAAVTLDVNQITEDNASSCDGADLSLIGLDCVEYWKIYIAIGLFVLLLIGPYLLPFIPRGRE